MDLGRWQHWLIIHDVQIQQRKPAQAQTSRLEQWVQIWPIIMITWGDLFNTGLECHFQRFLKSGMIFEFLKSFSGNTHAPTSFGIRHPFEGEKPAKDHSSLIRLQSAVGVTRESNLSLSFGALIHMVPADCNVCLKYHPRLFINEICFLDT